MAIGAEYRIEMLRGNNREECIFTEALKLAGPEREIYLGQACGDDAGLRDRVNSLLQASDESKDYLEPAGDGGFAIARALQQSAPCDEMPGDFIGRYKLLEKIGEGGWGVVWMAEQKEPVHRRVALKILKLGMDTKEVVARFESERQALAMMDHPNISKVFDGGVAPSGRPLFVMELVRGVYITDYCDQEKLSAKDRLRLFVKVCQAVQHAHQKGIIHRDLKPSNILVTVDDCEAVPKVIDFGIVKAAQSILTDKTLFTRFHSFVGTPVYTSPEQMQISSLDVDTRSDIYSLGVLLYELLSGRQPFNPIRLSELGIDGMRKVISEEDPMLPSAHVTSLNQEDRTSIAMNRSLDSDRLRKELRGEPDWIVMKCLEKNRERRYETANALAMDIKRYLNREPILAREPTAWYRMKKMIDRNRVVFGVSAALAVCLFVGSIAIATLGFLAIRSDQLAQKEADKSVQISEFIKSRFSYIELLVELQLKGKAQTRIIKEVLKETLDRDAEQLVGVLPYAKVELCDILGAGYFRIGEYESAESMFRGELTAIESSNEPDETYTVRALNHLGAALGRQGELELDEAEENIRKALRLQREELDVSDQEIARSLVNLSVVQVKKAARSRLSNENRETQLEAAVKSIEEALKLQREFLGDEHEEIAASLNELGFILACKGGINLIRAESVLEEALEMNRKFGDVTPAVASSLNLLAITQLMKGDIRDAFENYERVKSTRKSLEESTARDLVSTYDVSVWEHQNTGEESLEALHDVIALTIPRFDPDSLEVAGFLAIKAWTYNEEGRFVEAEEIAKRCLAIRELDKNDPDPWVPFHTQSMIGRAILGQAIMGQKDLKDAEDFLKVGYEGVKEHKSSLTIEHKSRLAECFYYLVRLYEEMGDETALSELIAEGNRDGIVQ